MLLCPAGEGAGHKFRVGLSHKSSWGFRVVVINEDLTTGPDVVGELPQRWQAFLARRRTFLVCVKITNARLLEI